MNKKIFKVKQDLLEEAISKDARIDKKIVNKVLEELKTKITQSLKSGFAVSLLRFGTFEPFTRHERAGVDPQTKERIIMPEVVVAKFRASSRLKKEIKTKK